MHDTQSAVEVQGQGHSVTTGAKICKIFNNSARDCSISLRFCTDWSRDTWCTTKFQGQRSRSQHDI